MFPLAARNISGILCPCEAVFSLGEWEREAEVCLEAVPIVIGSNWVQILGQIRANCSEVAGAQGIHVHLHVQSGHAPPGTDFSDTNRYLTGPHKSFQALV